jgi:hypothetical protein
MICIKFAQEYRNHVNRSITGSKIETVIKSLTSNKNPGPNVYIHNGVFLSHKE